MTLKEKEVFVILKGWFRSPYSSDLFCTADMGKMIDMNRKYPTDDFYYRWPLDSVYEFETSN